MVSKPKSKQPLKERRERSHPRRRRTNGAAEVTFWGVRGSIPSPGPGTVRYGGNTTCVEVRAEGKVIILDAGTGLRLFGRNLFREFGDRSADITLLLTHTHWDHIQGLPFFLPLLRPQDRLRILGYEGARHGLDQVLSSQMDSPFFPVGLRELAGNITIEELKEMCFEVGPIEVRAHFANHPGICVGYRLCTTSGSVAFFPDNEPYLGQLRGKGVDQGSPAARTARTENQRMIDFLSGTDVLIIDAQYDCQEYVRHLGWGHGCLDDVVALAIAARIKRLCLFHHDPDHDDATLERMLAHARKLARSAKDLQIELATEGRTLALKP